MSAAKPVPGRYAGVVPSAGASRRMGRPKELLRLDGSSFLERTVRALREGGCDPVLVVLPETAAPPARDALRQAAREAERAGARVLRNPDPGEGPITSLRLALAALGPGADGLVYLPVDHPLVRGATVRALLAAARGSGAALTVPVHAGRRGHPAVFGRALFAELLDPDLEGGARTVVHRHLADATLVPVDDEGVLADIDTPEAYAALPGAEAGGARP